jgi:pimeloyl-ACP methyl ester carboxylesterase/uncharacterized protein (DUF1330 family)
MTEASVVRTRSGADLFVRDWGSGPPVLLLAGWGMTSDLWGSVMLRLNAAGLRAVSFDRRGHGRSSDPGVLDYDLLADDLDDVMTALCLSGCTVVAHSGAGGEVVRCISRHGDTRIARIVLVGATLPAPTRTADNPEGLDPALFAAMAQQIADDLAGWIDTNARPFVSPETSTRTIDWLAAMVMNCSRRALVDYYREVARTDFREELRRVRVPITVIQGTLDVSAPEGLCGRRIASLMPEAEYLSYEGVAHGPMVTDAERLAGDIAARAKIDSAGEFGADGGGPAGPPTFAVAHLRVVTMGQDIVSYIESIDATLRPFGGRFRVHGGEAEVLEGDWSGDLVMIEFPDRRSARAWYASPAYQAILPLRLENAAGEVILIDAVLPGHRSVDVLAR